ncbi:hypothetical protein [Anaerotruncus rubiinfantis]|uniref:hypothetical protein n=1 Tax=Anaerotruncus rubiinfantis TaxID=1720200 RepID=UPI0034A3F843
MRKMDEQTKVKLRQEIRSNLKKKEMQAVEVEIMLHINRRLYQQGLITEEMYRLAKEEFLRT